MAQEAVGGFLRSCIPEIDSGYCSHSPTWVRRALYTCDYARSSVLTLHVGIASSGPTGVLHAHGFGDRLLNQRDRRTARLHWRKQTAARAERDSRITGCAPETSRRC